MPLTVMGCNGLGSTDLNGDNRGTSSPPSTSHTLTVAPNSTRAGPTQDVATSAPEGPQLTPTASQAPRLAPGTYVVFSKTESQGASGGIKDAYYAIPAEGGKPQPLLLLPVESSASLSPSGKTLAYTVSRINMGGRSELELLNLELGQAIVVPGTLDCGAPFWSPSGSEMALACGSGAKDIYLLTIDDFGLIQLTTWQDDYEEQLSPAWSPDGRWIAFLIYIGGQKSDPREGIYLIDTECLATAADCHESTLGPLDCLEWFVWSSDSEAVGCVEGSSIRFINISTREQMVMDFPGPIAALAWSPTGDQLAVSLPDSSGGAIH